MKICRFVRRDDPSQSLRVGVVRDNGIHDVTSATERMPPRRWPLPPGDQFIAMLPQLRDEMAVLAHASEPLTRSEVHLLSPVANPGKFVCGAGNWKHHGAPFGMMGFMGKATSSLAGPDDGVRLLWPDRTTVHEPELAIVIGRECRNIAVEEALSVVAGYTCAFDTTLKPEREDWAFCKSFDTYATIGPWLVTADEIADPSALSYRFTVNSELRGERSFADLTGSPADMIAFASTAMTLYPGDVIFSGAADVAPILPGDRMELTIPGIGTLSADVSVSERARSVPWGASPQR